MKTILRSLMVALAAISCSVFAANAHEGHLPVAEGTVKKLDTTGGKVSIAHGTIENLNMPPMTMSFKAKSPAMLAKLKEGDKVRFRAAEVGGVLTVISIEPAP